MEAGLCYGHLNILYVHTLKELTLIALLKKKKASYRVFKYQKQRRFHGVFPLMYAALEFT